MEFLEYPKALYRAGELCAVADAAAEAHARGEGFDDWHADQADEAPVQAAEKAEDPPPKRKPRKEA